MQVHIHTDKLTDAHVSLEISAHACNFNQSINQQFVGLSHTEASKHVVAQEGKCHKHKHKRKHKRKRKRKHKHNIEHTPALGNKCARSSIEM